MFPPFLRESGWGFVADYIAWTVIYKEHVLVIKSVTEDTCPNLDQG